jgi:hypothetical protein
LQAIETEVEMLPLSSSISLFVEGIEGVAVMIVFWIVVLNVC